MTKVKEQQAALSVDAEVQWALVERVAAGTLLQRSARLRMLLLHVGRHSVFAQAEPLHETEIGTVVFGRPERYDTSQDNIVRVNFSELRKRIQQHFEGEGREEPLRFDIPRGSYELRFFARVQDAFDKAYPELQGESTAPVVVVEEPAESATPKLRGVAESGSYVVPKRFLLTCYVLLAISVCSLGLAAWYRRQAGLTERKLEGWAAEPALHRFWQPFFDGPEPVDVVLADSSLALVQDITGRDLSLSDYIAYNYQPLYDAESERHQQEGTARLLMARNTGSAGDFKVAAMIQALGPSALSRITFARAYSAAAVRDHNSILLGSRRSNPWIELLERGLQYRFETSPDRHETVITVLHPQPGEQSRYVSVSDPSTRISYAVIAILPSPGGNAHSLLIAGTDSRATLAAGELLTDEKKLRALSSLVGMAPMDHLQCLIQAETMRDTPISAKVISIRTTF